MIGSPSTKLNTACRPASRLSMSSNPEKRRIGPFELEKKLGVGGMGIVYLATYLKGGQKVAVKVLAPDLTADPKVAKRFEREIEILKKLKHPNIVRYFGGGISGGQRFYAMEFVSGGTVDDVLKKKGRLSWEQAVAYGIQIAKALEHAHNAGIIHRDLKPGNLLLKKDSTLKLSDFGIARDTQSTALTAAGKTVGTMAYMAPEQITGRTPVNRRTDLYALGCVLFQMLTGRTPFESETQPEMLFKHVEDVPPSVREFNMEVPVWLEKLIEELLEKDADDRPYDALAVQVKLEEVKQKVAEQESIVRQTVAGGHSALTVRGDGGELTKVLGKKKSKKKKRKLDITPFYERTWFLVLCLLGLAGLVTWGVWPESEGAMYTRLKQTMAHDDSTHRTAADEEIEEFLERFPDSAHATEARIWLDEIAVIKAERQAENAIMRDREGRNDGEKLYLQGRRYELANDRLSALRTYELMQQTLEDKKELKPYITIAGKRIRVLQEEIQGEGGLSDFIRKQIEQADKDWQDGKTLKAQERWKAILNFISIVSNPELSELKSRVEDRLSDPENAIRDSQAGSRGE